MNSVVLYFAAVCIAGIQAAPSLPPLPVNPGGIGGLFRGPNLETIIKGPDGSQIVSEQLGGSVDTRLEPIIVPDDVGDQIAVPSVSTDPVEAVNIVQEVAPALEIQAGFQPVLSAVVPHIAATPEEPHIIETELVDAPEIEPNQSSDLKGPSGSISVRGSSSIISGPASTTISESVKKVPIATVPLQLAILQPQNTNSAVVPSVSAVAVPAPVDTEVQSAIPLSLPTDLVPPPPAEIPIISPKEIGIENSGLRTHLVPPAVPASPGTPSIFYNRNIALTNPKSNIPLISLTGTHGAGIADATLSTDLTPPHITIISSTQAPPVHLSKQNSIDLGQAVVSSTTSTPISLPSADVDASRFNLGQSNIQAVRLFNGAANWGLPLGAPNVIYSDAAPALPPSVPIDNDRPSKPLLITAAELQRISNAGSSSGPNIIRQSDNINSGVAVQDQLVLTNQIVSSTPQYFDSDQRQLINSPLQADPTSINVHSRSWPNEQPQENLPPTLSSAFTDNNHGTPIASVLDSVFLQPTDPKNREIIEFGGKQLENVGNIVPVIQHPVLLTGDLSNYQQIPTASISQLSSRNELDPNISNRYGRNAAKPN